MNNEELKNWGKKRIEKMPKASIRESVLEKINNDNDQSIKIVTKKRHYSILTIAALIVIIFAVFLIIHHETPKEEFKQSFKASPVQIERKILIPVNLEIKESSNKKLISVDQYKSLYED